VKGLGSTEAQYRRPVALMIGRFRLLFGGIVIDDERLTHRRTFGKKFRLGAENPVSIDTVIQFTFKWRVHER
jgi:hypothetical protein